ncbi:unnamed protein product (macronuclear) [Paramecium tetraurelia]|uniref:AB hydrolase-1 domain-containing protein n=1 Tax=Paramecium tetraurelia TaxID=5888 RepID=A0DN26_PARTE|nr:uncharacterized protein GSPATT00018648001 [Paramecium tetraurelia]CAK84443.1 unnamed protein product [Paramecium tetraurelia]|eukprot:XP_001451840.1 hypothetical protein (macronuclear) [Paramecium tetraurelia strain d4-2]
MENQESQQNSLADTQQQVCQTYQATTEFFDQLPNCITTLKKQYLLDKASVNTRFVLLCLTTLTTAGLTARITPSFIKLLRCRSLHCTRSVQPVLNIQIMIIIAHKIQLMNIKFSLSIIPLLFIGICYNLDTIWFIVSLLITLVYFCLRFICKFMIFPGSCSLFFKYYQLLDYNKNTVYKTINILKVLRQQDETSEQKQIQQAKDYFTLQHLIFQKMKGQLNQQQTIYSNLLTNLIELLRFQQNQQLIKNQLNTIQRFLDSYVDKTIQISNIMKPFKYDMLFGTLEQFRQEILITNPNTSRHIIKFKNISIDCIHLKNNRLTSPTVLFCNPNAFYYETLYHNSLWIKVYQDLKINLILWNYSEYGSSTGTVSPTKLIESGMFIAEYFQKKFNITTLGVHGQSMGGMVASEIAYRLNLPFLIADRTFSSLGQVVTTKMQIKLLRRSFDLSIARFLFNCVVNWDFPNYQSFYKFRGPKLLIQDKNDEIIIYKAQLQTGVVRQFFTNQTYSPLHSYFNLEYKQFMDFFFEQILPKTQTLKLSKSLDMLIHNQLQNHQQFYKKLKLILSQIDYCDNQFLEVMDKNATPEKIALFFGSFFMFNKDPSNSIRKIKIEIQRLQKEHYSQFNESREHIEIIVKCINQITKNYQKTQQIKNLRQRRNQQSFDYLIAISCGHNGDVNKQEEEKFKKYFMSKLIVGTQI